MISTIRNDYADRGGEVSDAAGGSSMATSVFEVFGIAEGCSHFVVRLSRTSRSTRSFFRIRKPNQHRTRE